MQANREITLSEIFIVARIAEQAIDRLLMYMPKAPPFAGA
jgi:hypothetical protein